MTIAHHVTVEGRLAFVQEARPAEPNGVTLWCLHTAGQTGAQWRHTLTPLTDLGYRVLVPDLPGHGHSEPAAGGVVDDLADYTRWSLAVLDALAPSLGGDRLVVVGCSIGGKLAQDLVCRHGDRLAAGVAMCAEAGPGRVKLHALRRELEDSAAPARRDRTYLGTRAVVGRAVPEEQRELIATMHCREDAVVSTSDLIGWGRHDVRDLLPGVPCPVTFVAGEDDSWVDPRGVESAARATPGGRYVLLEGYGHYPMEEMPDFAPVLDGWIRAMLPDMPAAATATGGTP